MDDTDTFDAAKTVAQYRDVVALRDAEIKYPGKAEFETIAQRLRDHWKASRGEDSLHEMTFGEQ